MPPSIMPTQKEENVASNAVCVHRCRFLEWTPSSIHCLAFNGTGDKVAVGREDGDIEIRMVGERWRVASIIHGHLNTALTSLAWTKATEDCAERLFGSSMDGSLFEIDFNKLIPMNVQHSYGGAVWSIAIHDGKTLAAACEDGNIKIFSVEDGNFKYDRSLIGNGSRALSLAWHQDGQYLFSGSADGIISRWDMSTGRNTISMTLERFGSESTIVWSIAVLQDLTVVSGDSLGHVQLWDGTNGTLLQSFSKLKGDVLAVAVNAENDAIFASGVDSQVIMLRKTNETINPWIYSYSHRAHTHDVRAISISKTPEGTEILVSGGIDSQVVWYPVKEFRTARPIKLSPYPQHQTVSLAHKQRLLLFQSTRNLQLWKLADSEVLPDQFQNYSDKETLLLPTDNENKLLVDIKISGELNIVCATISSNGKWIACSNSEELKLFSLDCSNGYIPHKAELSPDSRKPAHHVQFTPDSSRLIVANQTGAISIIDLQTSRVIKSFRHHIEGVFHEEQDALPSHITTLAISADGQWLSSGDLRNDIHIFNLDSLQHYVTVPRLDSSFLRLAFNPTGKLLVIACVNDGIHCFDMDKKTFSDWSRENSPSISLPRMGHIKGIVFNPAKPMTFYLYSQSMFCSINTEHPIRVPTKPETPTTTSGKDKSGHKRRIRMEKDETDDIYNVVHRYKPVVYLDFLEENELVVVEIPWLKVLRNLPDVLYRRTYNS